MPSSLGIGFDLGYDILGTVIVGWHARNDVGGLPYGDERPGLDVLVALG
jgi:hypothetical protein